MTALGLALAPVPARADDTGCERYCGAETPHPMMCIADQPACVCWDTCSAGGAGGSRPVNPAVIKFFGSIAVVVLFFIVPGRTIVIMGGEQQEPPGYWRDRWNAHQAALRADQQLGREVAREARALDDAMARARQAEEARAAIRARIGWTPPALVTPAHYACDQAMTLLPYREGWPVGEIESWDRLRDQCGPYSLPSGHPITDGGACEPGTLECLGVCCPADHPILNLCDHLCYASSDFRGAGEELGLRCASYRDCAVRTP